jgi:Leucine Rich repeat
MRQIVDAIAGSTLPALRRLELWLGDDNYGFDGDVRTYARMLDAIDASRLDYLGLRDAQISDDLAKHLAAQPWLGRLKTLDLSMGTIGDDGAQALCGSPYLAGMHTLDLSHHYIGAEWQAKLRALPCKVVLDDPQDEDDGARYVAVAE